MINNLIVSIEAVAPMFIILTIGVLIKKLKILNTQDVKKINKLVFNIFLPILLFSNLYGKNIEEAINMKMMIYSVIGVLLIYALDVLFVINIEKNSKNRGAMIQAIYRGNFVILGIPIVSNIYGNSDLAMTSMLIAVVVPIFNILAVITLEYFKGEKSNILKIIIGIIKNPLIIGSGLGIISVILDLRFPKFINSTISSLAGVGTPLAILALGASFEFNTVNKDKRNLFICIIGKLIVVPAIGLTLGVMLGFKGIEIVSLVAIFASPTAVSSYTMAQQMNSNYELAGNAVIFSSFFSCITIFICIFILKTLGLF